MACIILADCTQSESTVANVHIPGQCTSSYPNSSASMSISMHPCPVSISTIPIAFCLPVERISFSALHTFCFLFRIFFSYFSFLFFFFGLWPVQGSAACCHNFSTHCAFRYSFLFFVFFLTGNAFSSPSNDFNVICSGWFFALTALNLFIFHGVIYLRLVAAATVCW